MREFKGRVVTPGTVNAEAVVSHYGFNTLASLQGALQFGDKKATCGDQNNPDLHGKELAGKALCLPQTIGSTTGGLVLYCACAMERQPACMLFSKPIDSLAAAGSILASVWLPEVKMPVVDSLGEEFLDYVKDGMTITIQEDGVVCVDLRGRSVHEWFDKRAGVGPAAKIQQGALPHPPCPDGGGRHALVCPGAGLR